MYTLVARPLMYMSATNNNANTNTVTINTVTCNKKSCYFQRLCKQQDNLIKNLMKLLKGRG